MPQSVSFANSCISSPNQTLLQLILKGMNRTYDSLSSEYDFKDFAFSKLRERYWRWTGDSMEEKYYDSFQIRDEIGKLTNAGALIADDSPIRHSRLFCVRWNGLDKSDGLVDALDSAEYSGSLILLLQEGAAFVKRNMKTMWKKTADSRIDMPEYCEQSVLEALVNALIHREYTVLGSEVHVDMYDDRLTICSPGGTIDGVRIQDREIKDVPSSPRNPILADIFGRLGYMRRQGAGLKKIAETYRAAHNYRAELEPEFYSDVSTFQVTLYNLNYLPIKEIGIINRKSSVAEEVKNLTAEEEKLAVESGIEALKVNSATIRKIKLIFAYMGFEEVFGRTSIMSITGNNASATSQLLTKLKDAGLIEPVSGYGKGKYRFIRPQ